jgi:hypothetical protein
VISEQQARAAQQALLGMWRGNSDSPEAVRFHEGTHPRPIWMNGVGVSRDAQGSHVVRVNVDPTKIRPPEHIGGDYAPHDPRTGDFRYAVADFLLPSSVRGVPVQVQMVGPIVALRPQVAGIDWPSWVPVLGSDSTVQSQAQDAINQAAQEAAYQEKLRQEKATADVQQTIAQQAQQQGAQLQSTVQPTAAQVAATAKTWQTVAYVVAGAVVLGVGFYIYRSTAK